MRKRRVLGLFLAAVLLLSAVSGCSRRQGEETAGVTVRYGIAGAWDSLMPYNSISGSNYARLIYDKIYDRLAYVHGDGTLSPRAAKSWESADDGYAVLFHLDENAAFHDGTPVTAQNWVDTFRLVTDPECPAYGRSNFSVFTGTDENGVATGKNSVGAEALDEHTLKLTFKARTTPEEFLLARNREFYVLPTHLIGDTAPADVMELELWQAPVGSGPCRFAEEVVGSRLTLKANPDYQLGAPEFDELVITVMDKTSLLTSLLSGDLDYYAIGGSISEENAQVARDAGFTVEEGETPTTFYELMINNETVSQPIRQAIDLALDKELLCRQNTNGLGEVTASSILPGSAYAPEESWSRDVEKAREIAGNNGCKVLKLATISNRAGLAALMQQNLAEAGITVEIETVDSAALFAGMTDGSYDLAIASHTPSALPLWFTEPRLTPNNNLFHIDEEELNRYEAEIAAVRSAEDKETKTGAVTALEEHLHQELPFIPLWFSRSLHVQSRTVACIDSVSASNCNENVWEWRKS